MRLYRSLVLLAAALLALLVAPGAAQAGNAWQVNEKYQDVTFVDLVPCLDGYMEITISGRFVESYTVNANGEHFTFTDSGKFFARPVEVTEWSEPEDHGDGEVHQHPVAWVYTDGPTWSGQYALWGGGNWRAGGGTFTFTFEVTGKSSAGDMLSGHWLEHLEAGTPAGELRERYFAQSVCGGEVERF